MGATAIHMSSVHGTLRTVRSSNRSNLFHTNHSVIKDRISSEVWYYIENTYTKIGRIRVVGHPKLILLDGSSLNVTEGIEIDPNSSLTIYGGEKGTGVLKAELDGKCACHLNEEINVSQPTMSHHMKILCDSGIVVGRKEGKWMHYSISPEGARLAADVLKDLTNI